MKVAILHLSDIHLSTKLNPLLKRKDKVFDAIKNEALSANEIFIIVTGDVAFSGDKEEYAIGGELLNYFCREISDYTKKPCSVLVIPGNHDCLFEKSKESTRELLLKGLEAEKYANLDEYNLQICTAPQDNYFEFVESNGYNKGDEFLQQHKLLTSLNVIRGDYSIIFHCYNTSWHSRLHEEQGRMSLPVSQFDRQAFKQNADVVISLIHHPFNWQNPSSGRQARLHLERTSDFVLSGHEHERENYTRKSDGNTTYYIESGALQDGDDVGRSEFGLMIIDLARKEFQYNNYELKKTGDRYTKVSDMKMEPMLRSTQLRRKEHEVTDNFYFDFLEDPGSKFIHSQVDKIRMSDIFVYPSLRRIYDVRDSPPKQVEMLSGENLMDALDKDQLRVIFVGDDGSGKTAICKYLYKYLWSDGYIPVYINCENVKVKWSAEVFTGRVNDAIVAQYDNMTQEIASQLDRNKIVVLLDDFQYLKGSSDGMAKFVHSINKVFVHIVITGNAQLQFEPITTKNREFVDAYRDYIQLRITEFGKDLRYKLVDKWNRIGRIDDVPLNEILRMNDAAMKKMDSIIGKNFLPPYPIYLLTIIQSFESDTAAHPDYSLQGYYYDYLISDSLNKAIKDKEAMSFYYTFISEYAYYLFSEKIRLRLVSIDHFEKFFEDYKKNYHIGISIETVLTNLLNAKILVTDENNQIGIAYNYIYYFFIARYFSTKIHEDSVRDEIKNMCARLYREEYSNVILFLVHLSKDPIMINEIESMAKSLFTAQPICRMDTDVMEVNNMIENIPVQVIELMDVEKARESEYKYQAELEDQAKTSSSNQEGLIIMDDESPVDIIGQIVFAFKVIDILGQITKKHWGDLAGPRKYELAKHVYSLGLRTLSIYLQVLCQSKEILAEHIKSLVESKQIKQRDKIEQFSKNFIFRMSFMASYGIVKRISNSIGYSKLKLTLDELLEKMDVPSVELIDLSIKLDHYPSFPMDSVIKMKNKTHEKNYLAWLILRNLVLDYLYLFDTSSKTKQQLQDLLKISIKSALAIDNTSSVKRN